MYLFKLVDLDEKTALVPLLRPRGTVALVADADVFQFHIAPAKVARHIDALRQGVVHFLQVPLANGEADCLHRVAPVKLVR